MKLLTTILTISLSFSMSISAQTKKQGDYIESFTNNAPSGMKPRQMQYRPEDGDFLCVNGNNRFTRALYGNNTDYRIETSDRPAFALYNNVKKAKSYRNLRLYINGIQLDNAEYCESRYGRGRRTYLLRDSHWGKQAVLTVECVAMHDTEGCYWRFAASGFDSKDIRLATKLCNIANPKLRRNGDIGADKAGCFEPSEKEEGLTEKSLSFKEIAYITSIPSSDKEIGHEMMLSDNSDMQTARAFESSRKYFEELSSRVFFKTPDPYLNTLGGALCIAADGTWDGETWLHGAIGWRMPLAGWRAGYLGDVLGWNDRAISHFDAYAKSQVTNVEPILPAPTQDPKNNLARGQEKWGTQMYSNGYICRNPNRNDQIHHYDMNLNYIDELLWHFQYDADTAYMRKMWPVLKMHLEWEKRNFDPDNNHLYDAYCCIWASDALYYNGGEVTHSSAYNYRGNLLAAKIAGMIGEDPSPYKQEADAILKAMNERLWVQASPFTGDAADNIGHWAEYRDVMGLKRLHPDAALWSIYTPIDCGVGTPQQMYSSTLYIDQHIPHIPVEMAYGNGQTLSYGNLISTSSWMPYSWSINNVASAEIMHTALAFFEAGRAREGMALVKANVMDQMYLGCSPGNLGQISYYDAARGESYRDFGDNIGISARAIIQGVFGIIPQALDGKCIIRPGFPLTWDSLQVRTPYLSYSYRRNGKTAVLTIEQNFTKPLKMLVRVNGKNGSYEDYEGTDRKVQFISIEIPDEFETENAQPLTTAQQRAMNDSIYAYEIASCEIPNASRTTSVKIPFNASVTDIFRNEYLSPRPASTSLELPKQGIGEWCHPLFTVEINDSVFRSKAIDNRMTVSNIPFKTPQLGSNILFASLWDNYPDSVDVPLAKPMAAASAVFMIAGSTNHMQFQMENARLIAQYTDGSTSELPLIPPYNYCPIEQDYYIDGKAFNVSSRPLRISLSTGLASRTLGDAMNVPSTEVYGRELTGGAAQLVTMLLDKNKKVRNFRLVTKSNDIVVGIMGITLCNQ